MSVGLGPAFGKDFATSIGPVLVTPDEFDVTTARMSARVNGETWASGSLGEMLYSYAEAISALSAEQPLQPGDVFGGGTVGRGCGFELDRWIRPVTWWSSTSAESVCSATPSERRTRHLPRPRPLSAEGTGPSPCTRMPDSPALSVPGHRTERP